MGVNGLHIHVKGHLPECWHVFVLTQLFLLCIWIAIDMLMICHLCSNCHPDMLTYWHVVNSLVQLLLYVHRVILVTD